MNIILSRGILSRGILSTDKLSTHTSITHTKPYTFTKCTKTMEAMKEVSQCYVLFENIGRKTERH